MTDRAVYASNPEKSRGRAFATDDSPTRSAFQRDRDRILHSTAFRRLQHKTQVFLHHEGRHFRTRLTHTMEVSQVARSLARALGLDEDLAEAVALAHDLGHPPFGHAGERVLDEKMAAWGGFDHNVQALRVVTILENRYAEHDGLNLTWETLEGILKHNGPLLDGNGRPAGRYAAKGLPAGLAELPFPADLEMGEWAGLEAQSAAIADDIAYNAHDVDDAVRAELISLDDLREVPFAGPIVREVQARWPEIELTRQTHEVQRRLITRSIEAAIEESRRLIATAGPNSAEAARRAGQTLIAFPNSVSAEIQGLKDFLFANVYRAEAVMAPVRNGERVVARLFDYYFETHDLPAGWAENAERADGEEALARLVADFVSGMTDPYALDAHGRLFDGAKDFG